MLSKKSRTKDICGKETKNRTPCRNGKGCKVKHPSPAAQTAAHPCDIDLNPDMDVTNRHRIPYGTWLTTMDRNRPTPRTKPADPHKDPYKTDTPRQFFDDVATTDVNGKVEVPCVNVTGYYEPPDAETVTAYMADLIHKWGHDADGQNESCVVCDDVKWREAGFKPRLTVGYNMGCRCGQCKKAFAEASRGFCVACRAFGFH